MSIPNGDTTPSASDGTDFGTTLLGAPVTHVFTVENTGGASLSVSSLSLPGGFSVATSVVEAGGSTSFGLRCRASSVGTWTGNVSIASNDPSASTYTFAIVCQVKGAAPDIDVQGGGVSIANGDTTPSTSDGTDFGATLVGTPVAHTFTIANAGTATLNLGSLSQPAGFSLASVPASAIAAGASASFGLRCDASSAGTWSGVVSIPSDDPDENPYTFAVTCRASIPAPDIDVGDGAVSIANGDTTPSASDGTDFGSTPAGTPVTHTFSIENTGTATLHLSTLTSPAGFSLTSPPAITIAPGDDTGFDLRCDASTAGTWSGAVTIASDDPDENPYTFAVTCTVTP